MKLNIPVSLTKYYPININNKETLIKFKQYNKTESKLLLLRTIGYFFILISYIILYYKEKIL